MSMHPGIDLNAVPVALIEELAAKSSGGIYVACSRVC